MRLAHVALSSSGDSLDTGAFTAKDYLWVQIKRYRTGSVNSRIRVNGDSGSNYAHRYSGGANSYSESTSTTQTSIYSHAATSNESLTNYFITNKADKEKLMIIEEVNGGAAGAGNAPARAEVVAKWTNTSDQITSIQCINTDSGDLTSGTYITVFGASDDVITDEKTTLTNIPANTRYEEVDTRKIYRFKESDTLEQLNGSGNKTIMTNGNEAHYGIKINTGSDLVGKVISKVHFKIKQNENPTTENLVYVRLWRGSSFVHTFGTTDPDNIAIGTYTFYSFGTGGDFSTSSDGNATLQAGDRIVLSWDRGGSYNNTYIHMQYSTTSQYEGTSDSTSTTVSPTQESHWSDNATRDVTFKLEGSSGSGLGNKWIERGTA